MSGIIMSYRKELQTCSVADPGFPVGGGGRTIGVATSNTGTFWQNVCENKRIGSCWGGGVYADGGPWIRQWCNGHKTRLYCATVYTSPV